MKKIIIARTILGLWIYLWVLFLVRPFFQKDLMGGYTHLLKASREEKQSLSFGPEFYRFLQFCQSTLPPFAYYQVIGLDRESIEYRRAVYYLYPHRPKEGAEYLLVYQTEGYIQGGYKVERRLDDKRYILKKIQ